MATYVLIHGAGDVAWYWHLLEAELRSRGHEVVAPDLPCEDDSAGLAEYADTVVAAIGDRSELIVVAQSFGGFTAPLVCERVPVELLVLLAGMVPSPGEPPEDWPANTGHEQARREQDDSLAKRLPANWKGTVNAMANKTYIESTKVAKGSAGKGERSTATKSKGPSATPKPALLAGGNPQIAKADGDAPVQTYIAAIPAWKRDVGRRLDALIMRNVPNVRKAVRWNSPFYGIEDQGWFLGFHVFTHYVKVTFFRGRSLRPAPPGGTGKDARWIDIHEDDLDEAQMARWVKQAAAIPGWGNA